jgi:hypothetical protein
VNVAKRLVKVIPEKIKASLSGQVSVSFAQVEFARRRAQVSSSEEVKSYSNGTPSLVLSHHLLMKLFHSREKNEPNATIGKLNLNPPHLHSLQPKPKDFKGSIDADF